MTDLREAAADLMTTVQFAIKSGDWRVDGACDPTLDIERLRQALAQPDEVLAEREACAEICDLMDQHGWKDASRCALEIRARSEK